MKRILTFWVIAVLAHLQVSGQCSNMNLTATATCSGPGEFTVLVQTNFPNVGFGSMAPSGWTTILLNNGSNFNVTGLQTTPFAAGLGLIVSGAGDEVIWTGGAQPATLAGFNAGPLMTFDLDGNANSCITLNFEGIHNGFCLQTFNVEVYLPPCLEDQACGSITDIAGCTGQGISIGYTPAGTACATPPTVSTTSDINGKFCIDLPEGECVRLDILDCGNQCNGMDGVTTTDLVKLQRYILGLENGTLASEPWTAIIGDVNGDGRTTASDLLAMRKVRLGIITDTPIGDCILFDADRVWTSSSQWGGSLNITACDGDDLNLIVGILGDVDATCTCNDDMKTAPEAVEVLSMSQLGQKQLYHFTTEVTFHELYLEFDLPAGIARPSVVFANDRLNSMVNIDDHKIRVAIYSDNGEAIRMSNVEELISIVASDNSPLPLNPSSSIDNANWEVSPIAYASSTNELQKPTVLVSTTNYNQLHIKAQEKMENVSIRLYDALGRTVESTHYSNIGEGELKTIDCMGLRGFYFVEITSPKQKHVQKFVF